MVKISAPEQVGSTGVVKSAGVRFIPRRPEEISIRVWKAVGRYARIAALLAIFSYALSRLSEECIARRARVVR
jgi:hypothetical protein